MLTEAVGTDKIVQKKIISLKSERKTQHWRTPTFKGLAEEGKSAQESEMYNQSGKSGIQG